MSIEYIADVSNLHNMDGGFEQLKKDIQDHLDNGSIAWLLGAGISIPAGIPAIVPLTELVQKTLAGKSQKIFEAISQELSTQDDQSEEGPATPSTIETILNQLVDHIAIASRNKRRGIQILNSTFQMKELETAYNDIVISIAKYVKNGGSDNPKEINISHHRNFVKAIFNVKQGVEERSGPSYLFTLNYDTLLEDALGLEKISYWDGFEGGAVAFRTHKYGAAIEDRKQAYLVKLHGSIDWTRNETGSIVRTREGSSYIKTNQPIIIYPQANKYISTQKDPFSAQLELFRQKLLTTKTLVVCGYSLGDEHINEIIEQAMDRYRSELTLIVFSDRKVFDNWRERPWSNRLFWLNKEGIVRGSEEYKHTFEDYSGDLEWWTFQGLITIIQTGIANYVPQSNSAPNEQV